MHKAYVVITTLLLVKLAWFTITIADKREFIKISQAVGIGFIVMGVIGYIVKIIHIPINNILVYVSFSHLLRVLRSP
jgi:protein translocase SEC61 complex gamma subunit